MASVYLGMRIAWFSEQAVGLGISGVLLHHRRVEPGQSHLHLLVGQLGILLLVGRGLLSCALVVVVVHSLYSPVQYQYRYRG